MKKQNGFTLIELLVTLAVFAILVAVGIPQLNHLTNKNRMVSEINNMSGSLAVARSESIRRGRAVTVCSSADGATCNDTATNHQWELGWIVFMDSNRDMVVDTGETLLKIGPALTAGNTLRLLSSDLVNALQFRPDSTLRNISASVFDGFDQGTFVLCEITASYTEARAVNVNRLGRTSRAEDSTDAGTTVEDVNGTDVTCP